MAELRLPESVRARIEKLYQVQQEAVARLPETNTLNGAFTTALEWLGLDISNPNHGIDFQTGIITPAANTPTPILSAPSLSEPASPPTEAV